MSNKLGSGQGSGEETKEQTLNIEAKESEQKDIEVLPNQKINVVFQFMYHPEYIGAGNTLIVNMDNFKVFGKIKQIIPDKIVHLDPKREIEKP